MSFLDTILKIISYLPDPKSNGMIGFSIVVAFNCFALMLIQAIKIDFKPCQMLKTVLTWIILGMNAIGILNEFVNCEDDPHCMIRAAISSCVNMARTCLSGQIDSTTKN